MPASTEALLEFMAEHPLGDFVSERRRARMADLIQKRLTSVTIVMENLYDPHNVSAVVRTAEGFGLDRVHVVEQPNKYARCASILRGADRWVEIEKHDGLNACLHGLTAKGFILAVADVGNGCVPLDQVPVDVPVAIVMGSERDGLSKRAKQLADIRFTIPMAGFTESFNVSVSAAITAYDVSSRRRQLLDAPGELSEEDMRVRLDTWMRRSVKNADEVEARVLAERRAS